MQLEGGFGSLCICKSGESFNGVSVATMACMCEEWYRSVRQQRRVISGGRAAHVFVLDSDPTRHICKSEAEGAGRQSWMSFD